MDEFPLEELISNNPITAEDVAKWLESPVTQVFLDCIDIEYKACDNDVHVAVEKMSLEEAMAAEAGMKTCDRVLEIPQILIDYLNE